MSAERTKFKTLTIEGTIYEIFITGAGKFMAYGADADVGANTYAELEQKLLKRHKIQRLRIDVPFFDVHHGTDGRVVGRHAANGNWLVHIGSKKEQEAGYSIDQERDAAYARLRPLSTEEKTEVATLKNAIAKAEKALEAFVAPRRIKLREACEKAWREAGGD